MPEGAERWERLTHQGWDGPGRKCAALVPKSMTVATDDGLQASGDEAGTAPGDRRFRPDVQGLRAVAILLVVLYHARVPGIGGGYVGVDVFFVISGFVITGVLLRERSSTGTTSILAFYGRRARRIIPAATVVVVATVLASYALLGSVIGWDTAVDGQWASVFLANFHFAASTTNYLAAQRPPSPLQNYWSLAVEEQFYILYPTIFLVVAGLLTRVSLQTRLRVVLGCTVVGSYALSIVMTSTNASSAYFSPFTRAWELALGGLVAVTSDSWRRLPPLVAAGLSWLGLGAILLAAFIFSSATAYPGSLVALPVIGAALIIAAGTAQPTGGVESVLRQRPFQLLGLISYSLYLWHWPILTIAAEREGKTTLPVVDNVLLVALALVLAIGTYLLVENPVRHSRFLMTRRWMSIAMGLSLIVASLGTSTFASHQYGGVSRAEALAKEAGGVRCPPSTKSEIASLHFDSQSVPGSTAQPPPQNTRMVVAGDSTACTMLLGLDAVGPAYGVQVENASVIGCGIVSGHIAPFYENGVDVERYTGECQGKALDAENSAFALGTPDIIVWSSTFEKDSIVITTRSGTRVLQQGTREWTTVMLGRMEARLQKFIGTGATVILLLQPPFVNSGTPTAPTPSDADFARLNAMLQELAARHPDQVGVVNLGTRVCPSGPPCPYVVGGRVVRPDYAHYGPVGSLWVAKWLVPQILAAAKNIS